MSFNVSMHRAEIIFVVILVPFIGGILTASHVTASFSLCLSITFFICLLALCFYNFAYKRFNLFKYKKVSSVLCYLQLFLLGAVLTSLNTQLNNINHFSKFKSDYLKVVIDAEPQLKGNVLRFSTKVVKSYLAESETRVSGRLLLATIVNPSLTHTLQYGDELFVATAFKLVDPPFNPAEFDVKFWLATQNINHQSFLKENQWLRTSTGQGNPIIQYALQLRKKQVAVYRRLLKNEEAFAVACTLIMGYRSDLSPETLQAYSGTGTIHALSVSGMHVGIIYLILNWLLSFLDRSKALKIVKVLLIIALIWYYSLITGFCPAVLRSAIMLSVYILAKSFHKESNGYNTMGFAAFLLLIWNPLLIYDVGFQLSFISVFGLIYVQPKIYNLVYSPYQVIDKLWSIVALSLAAQVVTFPLSIYYFHQFPIYFILGNLFVMIPITLMMYLGLIILMFKAYFLAPLFEFILNFTNSGLAWIAKLPFSKVSAIWITKLELILLSLAILLFIYAFANSYKKSLCIALCSFLAFQVLLGRDKINSAVQQKIIFFSLRKNYAAAFISSDTAILVTDLCEQDKTYLFSIKPYLDQCKVTSIEFYRWESTVKTAVLEMDHQQIRFDQYYVLKYDPFFEEKTIEGRPGFQTIWLHNSPLFNPEQRLLQLEFKNIVADATNKGYQLKSYTTSMNIFHLEYHLLTKNNSYLVDLTK
jgi:competence protein ComEC